MAISKCNCLRAGFLKVRNRTNLLLAFVLGLACGGLFVAVFTPSRAEPDVLPVKSRSNEQLPTTRSNSTRGAQRQGQVHLNSSKSKSTGGLSKNRTNPAFIPCPESGGMLEKDGVKLDCRKRPPDVIGIGMEKCGTGALAFFLTSHPALKHSNPQEIYYWNKNLEKGLEWYIDQMPVASQLQVIMEKTPSYIFERGLPFKINRTFPEMKFVVMIRDPVIRAMSDYLHLLTIAWPEFFQPRPHEPGQEALCFLNHTFETSVITPNDEVNVDNAIITHGIYVTYLRRWLAIFPREQFLIIDGNEFIDNPLAVLQEIESFLGLPKYFDEEKLYFDEKRGFFCKAKPWRVCPHKSKGVPHPPVQKEVEDKLKAFYHPFNVRLEKMVGKTFSWT